MLRRVAYSRGFPRASVMRGLAPRSFGRSRRLYSDDVRDNIGDLERRARDFGSRLEVVEKGMVDVKQTTNDLRTKLGFRDINHKIDSMFDSMNHNIDAMNHNIDSKIDGMSHKLQGLMKDMANNQQKQFDQFCMRGFFGIIALSMLLVGSAWVIPRVEGWRLDSEIKRRAIVKHGLDQMGRSV